MAQVTDNADGLVSKLMTLAAAAIRTPVRGYWDLDTSQPVVEFSPALSAAEQAIFDDLRRFALAKVTLTHAEYQDIKDDIDGLRTYFGTASPTNAQSVAAIKAIIVILRAILRD